ECRQPRHIAPPVQVASFACGEDARASRPAIESLAADEVGRARCCTQSTAKEFTVPRSASMTVLALLLATTAASAAKPPAKIVVHEGDSLQAAIDAASPGATIVVEPGLYQGDGAVRAITITKDNIHLVGAARRNHPVLLQQTGTQAHGIWVSPADSTDPDDPE